MSYIAYSASCRHVHRRWAGYCYRRLLVETSIGRKDRQNEAFHSGGLASVAGWRSAGNNECQHLRSGGPSSHAVVVGRSAMSLPAPCLRYAKATGHLMVDAALRGELSSFATGERIVVERAEPLRQGLFLGTAVV